MQYTSREVYEYISHQTHDPIIEWKTCRVSGTQFPIYQSDLVFYDKISSTFDGVKFQVPTPTLCPEERQRRRLSFRNERKLYKRTCDGTGESLISIYSPDKPYKVYSQKYRWSDARDPLSYGKEFDFEKRFTEQFSQLMFDIPRMSSWVQDSENCAYTNFMRAGKDNYLAFASSESENVLYSVWTTRSLQCVDCLYCNRLSHSYRCFQCHNSEGLYYSQYCNESSNLYGCYGCDNCHDCFLSANLTNQSYYFENTAYTKQEYEKLVQLYISQKSKLYAPIKILVPDTISSQNCLGSEIFHCKNSRFCFGVNDIEDCKYCYEQFGGQKDCMDCMGSVGILCYESGISVHSYQNLAVINSAHCNSSYYSDYCINSSHLFGCIGLRNKSYCIFNKQYSKDEYEKIIRKIIEHMQSTSEWGEFFHPSLSPFGYNETVAQEYFPLERVGMEFFPSDKRTDNNLSLREHGYHRSDYSSDPIIPVGTKTLTGDQIPSDISLISDDILKSVFVCEISGRPYRIIKQELDFYRKHSIPLPRKHPDIRHEERMKLRPGRTLFLRNCDKCGKEMLSVYPAPSPSEAVDEVPLEGRGLGGGIKPKVYCEDCYKQEVYA